VARVFFVLVAVGIVAAIYSGITRRSTDVVVHLDLAGMEGRPLTVATDVGIQNDISRGVWLVVFFDEHCQKCVAAAPTLEDIARRAATQDGGLRVAVVSVANRSEAEGGELFHDASRHIVFGKPPVGTRIQTRTPSAVMTVNGRVNTLFNDVEEVSTFLAGGPT
jgi:hypothetical protein